MFTSPPRLRYPVTVYTVYGLSTVPGRGNVGQTGEHGEVVRKAGIMGVVVHSGQVRTGDAIVVDRPAGPHVPLEPV